jgi:hypothetical protein
MLRQAKDVGDPAPFSLCFFQPPQESRDGKRGIAAPHHLHVRTPLLEAADAPSQSPPRAPRRRGIARAQHRAHELPALPVTDEERMLPGLIVVAVQAGELRLAVGGIVSGGDIQDHPLWGLREGAHRRCCIFPSLFYVVILAPWPILTLWFAIASRIGARTTAR